MAASAPTPAGFNIYDLLTRVTPGLFVLTIVAITAFEWSFLVSSTDSSFFTVIALFVGFLTGEIIDSFRMWMFAAPKPFRILLYNEQKNDELWTDLLDRVRNHHFAIIDPAYQSFSKEGEFWPMFQRNFNIEEDLKDGNEIYLRLAVDLDADLTALTRRYQTTTMFVQNMRLATLFAIFSTVFSFTIETGASYEARVVLLMLLITFYTYLFLFKTIENTYVRLLLVQFDMAWPAKSKECMEQRNLDEF
jgi:hypothetical protein